jgi:secreted trypsin-like serine protease
MTVKVDKKKDTQWYAVGIVSFGPSPCGMRDWPGVYTKTANYVNWIVSKLKA